MRTAAFLLATLATMSPAPSEATNVTKCLDDNCKLLESGCKLDHKCRNGLACILECPNGSGVCVNSCVESNLDLAMTILSLCAAPAGCFSSTSSEV